MPGERAKAAEWHADKAHALLNEAWVQAASKPEGIWPAMRDVAPAATAHALTALALRKVGGR